MSINKNQLNEFFYTTDGTVEKTPAQSSPNLPNIDSTIMANPGINTSSTTVVTDPVERRQIIETIANTKIQLLDSIKDQLSKEYHRGTNGLIDNYSSMLNTNRFKTVQDREIRSNNIKLNKLQNDILTVRRLIEHNENNYQLKQDQLYILKNMFFCLVIVIILTLLSNSIDAYSPKFMSNVTGMSFTKLISLCVIGVFAIKLLFYKYVHRLRNNVISRKYDWPDPKDLQESEKISDVSKYQIRALKCTPGSHPSKQNPTRCVKNVCRCDNGEAKKGIECEWDTINNTKLYAQNCKKCDKGYTLVNRKCVSNKSEKCKPDK